MATELSHFIRKSSRAPIVQCFGGDILANTSNHKLVAGTNPLLKDAVGAIKKHSTIAIADSDMVSYISASVLSHLMDGWNYLSFASRAYLDGNFGVAIHLAYYAELRAVMSLLASEGVGIFNFQHISVLQTSKFEVYKSVGTHEFAWKALNKWCKSNTRPSVDLLDLFSVQGKSFRELVEGFHPSASSIITNSIAKRWLLLWARDVKRFKRDRDIRNTASYRPQSINHFGKKVDAKDAVNNIYSVFQTLSPRGSNPFYYLDIELLRLLLRGLHSKFPAISMRGDFEELAENAFTNVGLRLDVITRTLLLQESTHPDIALLFNESRKSKALPLPVISRATLLLRVATGFGSQLLKDAHIEKNALEFVWNSFGIKNGFWSASIAPPDYQSLWSEIESEHSSASVILDSANNSLGDIREASQTLHSLLSQLNRALLWGI